MVHDGGKPGAETQIERLFLPANNIFELPKQQHLNTHEIRIAETLPGWLDKFFNSIAFPELPYPVSDPSYPRDSLS
jgi:hypothetical protein